MQSQNKVIQKKSLVSKADSVGYSSNDTSIIIWIDSIGKDAANKGLILRNTCKGYAALFPFIQSNEVVIHSNDRVEMNNLPSPSVKKAALLSVKGNVLYDVFYRSRIDTPFAESNVYQHTIQTRLDLVYKDKYPFKVYLTTRFSNSSLFRKYTDLNFQFNPTDFSRLVKNRIIGAVESYVLSNSKYLDSLRQAIELKKAELLSIRQQVQGTDFTQKLVEERERKLHKPQEAKQFIDSAQAFMEFEDILNQQQLFKFTEKIDSSEHSSLNSKIDQQRQKYQPITDSIDIRRKRVDSLAASVEQLELLYKKAKSLQQSDLKEWRKEIEETKDVRLLTQKLRQFQLPDSLLPKGYKPLLALQSFGVGRSVVNYSELSVKNTSITGLHLEYNPHYYYAFAAGKVDYRFRDYIIPAQSRSNQFLALARFGKGMKNGTHLIFTYYTGRRQLFNASVASRPGNSIPEYNLAGFTLEGSYHLSRNTILTAEIAKSTIPYYSLDSLQKKGWMHSVTKMKSRSNEAYSIKLNSYLPKTQTRLTGSFRYIGANFQSFSTFTTGASQINWLTKIEQPFFKRQLKVIASLQQNDYSNPFVATAYKSSSVLASFQANLRIKKWPAISLGYYPSYQLTKLGDNNYSESRYYSLVANAGYYYKIKEAQMSAFAVYTQFYNQSADSSFVYFNSKNYMISQSASFKKLSMLLNLSVSDNTDYSIYTIENNHQYEITKHFTIGAGVKYNYQTVFNNEQWGYTGNFILKLGKVGEIQLMADKGFLPGPGRTLVENKTGRLTYFKTF